MEQFLEHVNALPGNDVCCDQCWRVPVFAALFYIGFNLTVNQLGYEIMRRENAALVALSGALAVGWVTFYTMIYIQHVATL